MDTNLYWRLRGSYAERKSLLASAGREFLEAAILDAEYNYFLSERADYNEERGDNDPHGHGKRLPYIGWFWRHLEFSEGRLPIGDCGSFVGFMPNNKWSYPERYTTPAEFVAIVEVIDAAMAANQQGGDLSKIIERTNTELEKLWPLLQTMCINDAA